MKRLPIIAAGIFLLLLAGLALYVAITEPPSLAQKVTLSGVTIDWVEIGDSFYLDVRNDSGRPFTLDVFFMAGFNIEIAGFDAEFKKVYTRPAGDIDLDRARPTLVTIAPGNHHRSAFTEELKELPPGIKYVKLRWILNEKGTELPSAGLETSFYELKKEPGPRKEERISLEDFRSWKEKEALLGITIDWIEIDNVFYLEVKNGSSQPFLLDDDFLEGYNVMIIGVNSKFKKIHKTIVRLNVERAMGITLAKIDPGNYHRTAYQIDRCLETLPKQVKYIKIKWLFNDMGPHFSFKPRFDEKGKPLPLTGLETSLYEIKKAPGK